MFVLRSAVVCLVMVHVCPRAQAGLYCSSEEIAELPSQWRGFLLDQRALRNSAVKASGNLANNPLRARYLDRASHLAKTAKERKLSADEAADLGALYVRLGEIEKAVEVLRTAQRLHPNHFRVVANLGTAWQLQGDLCQATVAIEEAVRLAPGKWQKVEEYQLKLVRQRQRQPRDSQALDDLFGVRFVDEKGEYRPGKLAPAERQKLPASAVAVVQQLALWLPADGRLLWQLAELAAAHGDIKTAAAIMDGCVTEFGMNDPTLRRHRQQMRAAADEFDRRPDFVNAAGKSDHQTHGSLFKPRSRRPLANNLDASPLPAVSVTGVNALPWSVLNDTTVDRKYQATFSPYLRELDDKQIALSGFMQPLGDNPALAVFMLIEYPVGCWYCEMPEIIGIVRVELPAGKTAVFTRSLIKVVGKLALNAKDPENFLYTIKEAKVMEAD